MKRLILSLAAALALGAGPAFAGNIVLTGHDNDFHQSAQANAALQAELNFIKNGSTLPVLTFDDGSELTSALDNLGIGYVNVNPGNASDITDALFDYSKYSAFAVASVTSCGGCDNTDADIANIVAHASAIADFFNAGGGILGLAGAANPNAYAYVPEAATNAGGSPPSSGFLQTADGLALGLPAVNGDATHNFFNEPGTGGLSSAFVVTERAFNATTGSPETIALKNGFISGGTIGGGGGGGTSVPEPSGIAMLGLGLLGLFFLRRRQHG